MTFYCHSDWGFCAFPDLGVGVFSPVHPGYAPGEWEQGVTHLPIPYNPSVSLYYKAEAARLGAGSLILHQTA